MADNKDKKNGPDLGFMEGLLRNLNRGPKTPSEKICELAVERDKIYDKIKSLEKSVESSKESGYKDDFAAIQIKMLTEYKKELGKQIKKLIDET